ncbi:hypothetical protein ENBRE01_2979 [Enteropsectra breve]|nr:hypothetical protein ENBRE01_2979 [Enteropsectra breve]
MPAVIELLSRVACSKCFILLKIILFFITILATLSFMSSYLGFRLLLNRQKLLSQPLKSLFCRTYTSEECNDTFLHVNVCLARELLGVSLKVLSQHRLELPIAKQILMQLIVKQKHFYK